MAKEHKNKPRTPTKDKQQRKREKKEAKQQGSTER